LGDFPPEARAMVQQLQQQLEKLGADHKQALALLGDKDKDRQIEVMNIKADYDAQMARVQMDYETKLMAAQVKMATDNSVAGDGSKDAADAMLEMQRMRMDTEAKFAKLESDYQRELLKVGKDLQIAQMQAQSKQAEQSQQKGLRRDSDLAKFEKIHEQIQAKLVQASPGVPVGSMVATGQVALGFQQLSELMGLPGIAWALLPEAAKIETVFSGAVAGTSAQPEAVRQVLAYWASAETGAIKARHGMAPA
jgi:hypothetical protein